jgi:hypothetical protein
MKKKYGIILIVVLILIIISLLLYLVVKNNNHSQNLKIAKNTSNNLTYENIIEFGNLENEIDNNTDELDENNPTDNELEIGENESNIQEETVIQNSVQENTSLIPKQESVLPQETEPTYNEIQQTEENNISETTTSVDTEVPVETEEIQQQEVVEIQKSIYDYEFDVNAIKQELINIGTSQGLTHVTSDERGTITPDNSSWGNPITASSSFQGQNLENALKNYVRSMPSLVVAYGGEPIEKFTIYVENLGNGNYKFYFLY